MKAIFFILIVCLLAGVVVMPATVKLGSLTLYRPYIDFNLLGHRFYRDLELKLGLDLQGGTRLVYEADITKIPSDQVKATVEAARNNIERRVNLLGVTEFLVQTSNSKGSHRLIVELPGVKDINQAMAAIGQTAFLEFRESSAATPSSEQDFMTTGLIPIKIIEQKNIGATLGQETINQSILAGLVGLGMVCLFMIGNYGVKGMVADMALVIYVLLSVAVIKLVPITLTLAGIAGLVLSIGMAVDANILVFERIKEELRWGRPTKAALELGFYRAWSSIRDSNISSLITAGILFWFGTGLIRGFALTLALGIGVSLFTATFVTKALLKIIYDRT